MTWGTSPQDVLPITGVIPNPDDVSDPNKRASMIRALDYKGLVSGTKLTDVVIDKVLSGHAPMPVLKIYVLRQNC